MTTDGTILGLAAVSMLGLLGFGIWRDPVKPWIDERMWRRDQDRITAEIRKRDMQRRAAALNAAAAQYHYLLRSVWAETGRAPVYDRVEVERFEAWFSLPSAPDPKFRA